MKLIYFARHGECQANVDGLTAGSRNDSPLTKLGRQQAEQTAEALKGIKFDLIVSAPLCRCSDTARIIADKLGYSGEIKIDPILTERDFGIMSAKPHSIALPLIDAGTVEGQESLTDFAERMSRALDMLKKQPGSTILVVGHSGAERMMRTLYENRPYQTWLDTESLHNGKVREYKIEL